MLTALDEEEELVLGLDLGADDYVTKPFSVKELIARMQAAHRRHSVRGNQVELIIGDLELLPSSLSARVQNRDVELTSIEVGLLQLLVKARADTCTAMFFTNECCSVRAHQRTEV